MFYGSIGGRGGGGGEMEDGNLWFNAWWHGEAFCECEWVEKKSEEINFESDEENVYP